MAFVLKLSLIYCIYRNVNTDFNKSLSVATDLFKRMQKPYLCTKVNFRHSVNISYTNNDLWRFQEIYFNVYTASDLGKTQQVLHKHNTKGGKGTEKINKFG